MTRRDAPRQGSPAVLLNELAESEGHELEHAGGRMEAPMREGRWSAPPATDGYGLDHARSQRRPCFAALEPDGRSRRTRKLCPGVRPIEAVYAQLFVELADEEHGRREGLRRRPPPTCVRPRPPIQASERSRDAPGTTAPAGFARAMLRAEPEGSRRQDGATSNMRDRNSTRL